MVPIMDRVIRESCEGCCKEIYTHNPVVICQFCSKMIHYKCSIKLKFIFDNDCDSWLCPECFNDKPERYNPFRGFDKYNKHSPDQNNYDDDILKISSILEACNYYDKSEIGKVFASDHDESSKSEKFSVIFNNIDGNSTNFDRFSNEISNLGIIPSIIAIAETNIDECHKNLYQLNGYESVYLSKEQGKNKGSGIGLYIKDNINFNVLDSLSVSSQNLQALFIETTNTNIPQTIGVVYRLQTGSLNAFYLELDKILSQLPNNNVIITGDFNINLHQPCSEFENTLFSYGFVPSISIATHEKPGCSASCIDNILTNSYNNIQLSGVISSGVSHHLPIFCIFDVCTETETSGSKHMPKYDFCESNVSDFIDKLKSEVCDYHSYYAYNESEFNSFANKMTETIDECFKTEGKFKPSKRNRLLNPWITTGVIAAIDRKNYLYKIWKKSKSKNNKSGSETAYENYKKQRQLVNKAIKNAKSNYYSNKFEAANGNTKKTWEIINELRGKKKGSLKPSFIVDDKLIKDRRVIANEFNKYFTSIAHNMNGKLNSDVTGGAVLSDFPSFEQYMDKRITDSIHLSECSSEEIMTIINELQSNKSSDISINLLKRCSSIIAPVLSNFFNTFMNSGIFPSILKVGKITPIYKKGNPQKFDNYRPISTLPIFSKIFEKLIYSRLYCFLTAKGIIYENQFGFRKYHSTSHAVNYSVNKIRHSIENRKHVIGLFIDLSKAFDTIDHTKLMAKLENYGIRGKCYQLLGSYLDCRQQYTTFLGENSKLFEIIYGVPQGSVLGPLLFLIYINDIINSTKDGHFVLFADDTNIYVVSDTKEDVYTNANIVMGNINKYMLSNQLHINMTKCAYMYFRPYCNKEERMTCARSRPFLDFLNISVNGIKVKQVSHINFLGVFIDDNLNWNKHLEQLANKLRGCVVTIKRIKKFIPKSKYTTIYHTLFLSHLRYGISAWGGVSNNKLLNIFTVQKRCIRLLFGKLLSFDNPEYYETCARVRTYQDYLSSPDYSLEPTKPLFTEHNLLTVHNLYNFHVVLETFKVLKYHQPISLFNLFNFGGKHNLLKVPSISLEISRFNFIYRACVTWNACSKHIFNKLELTENILIPGSTPNSDFTTSVGFVKSKIKSILSNIQSEGDPTTWHDKNLQLSSLNSPDWTWGL